MPAESSEILAPTYVSHLPEMPETASPAVPVGHYLWILRRHVWKMVGFVITCVLMTFIVSARLQPIYESTSTIDVDRQAPDDVVGQDSNRTAASNDADQFLATQIKLIQSDAVLRPVAEQYRLLEREHQINPAKPEMAQRAAAAPITLKRLSVKRPPNTYLLLISYRSPDANLASDVSNAIANSYLLHTYDLRIRSSASLSSFMERQLDELKAKMERSSMALAQFEKDLDVVNPEDKTNILSARLLQLNTEYTSAQADRVRAEAAWNAIKSGSLGTAEGSPQGAELAKLEDVENQAKERFAQVKSTYGANHPEYKKAANDLAEVQKEYDDAKNELSGKVEAQYKESSNREEMLKDAVADTKAEWDHINARSFEYQRLKQEADTDKTLYDELVKKIRESDINAGFQNNNVRIADHARPAMKPVFPNMKLNLVLALIFSIILAVGAAILVDSLDTTLRDPNQASRFLGVDVLATIPLDRSAAQLPARLSQASSVALATGQGTAANRGAGYSAASGYIEAVRALRNTILLSDFEGRLHSLLLTSACPSEGKTTLAAHLGVTNADRGKKTLLVDGDLRRPTLHGKFGLSPRRGLGNVLTGEAGWKDVIIPIEGAPNLDFLPAGPGSHRAADLIGPRLAGLFDEFAKEYELVIMDSPPLLGFAECLQMAAGADGVLIVSKAGETKRRAVAEVVETLRRLRANIVGVVLNQVSRNTSATGYYSYYYYGYYGKYSSRYRYPKQADGPQSGDVA